MLLGATFCHALDLHWDAPAGATQYLVWLRTSNGPVVIGTTTNTSLTVTNSRREVLGVSAVGTNGFESDIAWGEQPAPVRVRLTVQEAESPTGPWTTVTNTVLVATLPAAGFYRGKMEIER
jgi:hypothetical protein